MLFTENIHKLKKNKPKNHTPQKKNAIKISFFFVEI